MEVRSRCPALHSSRDCSRQMALGMAVPKAKAVTVTRYYSTPFWPSREGIPGGRD